MISLTRSIQSLKSNPVDNFELVKLSSIDSSELCTSLEIEEAAHRCGMELSIKTLGPFYRAVIRLAKKGETGKIIGYTTGSIIPPLLRQETMVITSVNSGNSLTRKRSQKENRGWTCPTTFGLSLLLGAYAGRFAFDKSCSKAELLAINDSERQHSILKRHYLRLGLKSVREITESISSIPGDILSFNEIGSNSIQTSLINC
jgi:hypothetical protein